MRIALLPGLIVLVVARTASATTFQMTTADDWTILQSAQAGDIVEIASGTYQFRVYLDQIGTAASPIIIRAQDPNDRPVWNLGGRLVDQWPGSYGAGDANRGCWQVAPSGAYYEISGIVFRNCRAPSSAGIRMINSGPVTIRDCLFEQNTNGLTGASTDLVIEFSEFRQNGKTITTGNMTHNMYVYGGKLAVRYSFFHDGLEGQDFHVRAYESVLEYNWFARSSNYVGDIMTCGRLCGGTAQNPITQTMVLRGNVIIQGTPINMSQMLVLMRDGTGGSNDNSGMVSNMDLTLLHNTIIGTPRASGLEHRLINFRNDTVGTHAHLHNNIIVNIATVAGVRDAGLTNWSVDGTNNWVTTGTDAAGLTGTVEGSDPGFVNVAGLDITLTSAGAARGQADLTVGALPVLEYFQNETLAMQYRVRASANDLGAFEYGTSGVGTGPYGAPPPLPDGGATADGSGSADGAVGADGATVGGGDSTTPGAAPAGLSGGCGCDVARGPMELAMAALAVAVWRRRCRRA